MLHGLDSASVPTSEALSEAWQAGFTFWGAYVGGAAVTHTWIPADFQKLEAAKFRVMPIWVPKLDLSEDPAAQFAAAMSACVARGCSGSVVLDTEHSQSKNPKLKTFVDMWNKAAALAGWTSIVYSGAGYHDVATNWLPDWGTKELPSSRECIQTAGNQKKFGMTVDVDIAFDDFPFAAWGVRAEHMSGSIAVAQKQLAAPVIGIAVRPQNDGYWLLGADGGVFGFGGAQELGNLVEQNLQRPPTGIAAAPDGAGYYIVCGDGGVDCFGSAHFAGSIPGLDIAPAARGSIPD
jgi:hypothetical protein